MKIYWWKSKNGNFGDDISPIIMGHFLKGQEIEYANRDEKGKILGIGSIMASLQDGDKVWGTGSNQPHSIYKAKNTRIYATRGPRTREQITGIGKKEVIYGDPGILLPLVYNPKVKKEHEVGIIPHYIDKDCWREKHFWTFEDPESTYIDIQAPWKEVIKQVKSCKMIIRALQHNGQVVNGCIIISNPFPE